MTTDACLQRIHLFSPQPEAMARFYCQTYGLETRPCNDKVLLCASSGLEVAFSEGPANQIKYALFALDSESSWRRLVAHTSRLEKADTSGMAELPSGAIAFRDPDGNLTVFAPASAKASDAVEQQGLPAVLQHFALRTNNITEMLRFYSEELGFTVSDRVLDDDRQLKACFLRTNSLHHALALFGAPVNGFDHQSFETTDWGTLKSWADRMGDLRTEIVWGVGRHGPGNDVFFMVRDPDGNLVEISSEIETCADDRPAGVWRHEEHTLNLWGKAIMRS